MTFMWEFAWNSWTEGKSCASTVECDHFAEQKIVYTDHSMGFTKSTVRCPLGSSEKLPKMSYMA